MIFISLGKFRNKPTKKASEEVTELMKGMMDEGIKFVNFYWTLGRYDTVVIMDASDEKTVMKANIKVNHIVSTETLIGITREDAKTLVE